VLFIQVVADTNHSSSTSDTEDEAIYTTRPDDRPINKSGDPGALLSGSPNPTQPDTSRSVQGLSTFTLADDVPRLQLLKEDQRDVAAELTSPLVGQTVFNTNFGLGQNEVLPISGNNNVLDSSLLATTQGNWHLAQSQNSPQYNIDIGIKAESRCDGFYPGDAAMLESRCDGYYPGDASFESRCDGFPSDDASFESRCDGFYPGNAAVLESRCDGFYPGDAAVLESRFDGFYPGDASFESRCDGFYHNDAAVLESRCDGFYPDDAAMLESRFDGDYSGDASLKSRWDGPHPGDVASSQWEGL
jgi:hypothetical protein